MTITKVPVDQFASVVIAIIVVAMTLSYTAFGVTDFYHYPPSLIWRGVLAAFTI